MSETPGALPGDVREPDDALGLDALDAVRQRIGDHLEQTQGAWQRLPMWRKYWPVALAAAAALGWVGYGLSRGALGVSAVVALIAASLGMVAVVRAPRAPAFSEQLSLAALALAVGSAILEVIDAYTGAAVPGGSTIGCARAIGLGALAPFVMLGAYLRFSKMPARRLHVAALVAAAFVSSGAAVWSECPGTLLEHVMLAHALIPLGIAAALAAALRPLLRGAPLSSEA